MTLALMTPHDLEQRVLAGLAAGQRYEDVAAQNDISRGKVYSIAVQHNARKNEARIQERVAERRRRQQEFMREVMNATHSADVLDFLDGLPDNSVDLHITSVPYNLGKQYGGPGADRVRFHYWLGWMLQVASEWERTLKPGGVLFMQAGSTKTDDGVLYPIDTLLHGHLHGMGLSFQSRVAWVLKHGLTPKRRLAERFETALVFAKGEPAVFNPTPGRTPQKDPGKRAFKGPRRGELSGSPLGAWPSNVWTINGVGHNHPEKTGHPAQFPEELVRRAVNIYTLPGHRVVDTFVGSGTTAAVCIKTGREFTGCDLFYGDMRAQRLAKVAPDLLSALPGITDESLAVWQAEAVVRSIPAGTQLKLVA